jgi:hypothetical protein
MALNKFFRFPWATTGDKTAVPDTTQPDGSVSYPEGFGGDYELDPDTDPDAKRVPRDQTNQYLFDITTALREYQIAGVPDWITNAQNGGTAFAYAKGATVKYTDGNTYISLVDANTDLPTVTSSWMMETPYNLTALRASLAQAQARTDNDTLMTPLRTGNAIEAAFNALSGTGWFKIPGTLLMVQYGTITLTAAGSSVITGSFTFPIPFTTAVYGVYGTVKNPMVTLWTPMTITMNPTSVTGGTFTADTADPTKLMNINSAINYLAIGL